MFKGAPIGLQVVGQRLEEEAVLGETTDIGFYDVTDYDNVAMMEEVDDALRLYKTQHLLA